MVFVVLSRDGADSCDIFSCFFVCAVFVFLLAVGGSAGRGARSGRHSDVYAESSQQLRRKQFSQSLLFNSTTAFRTTGSSEMGYI